MGVCMAPAALSLDAPAWSFDERGASQNRSDTTRDGRLHGNAGRGHLLQRNNDNVIGLTLFMGDALPAALT